MADLRAIDIFVRAHDEASKVFAKISAAEKAFMADQGKSIRARVQQVNDGIKAENAAHKAGLVTRAREQAKSDEAIRRSQSDTVEHAKRKQSELVLAVAKSNRSIMEIHAKTASQISVLRERDRLREEAEQKRRVESDNDAASKFIANARKLSDLRRRATSNFEGAIEKGGTDSALARNAFPDSVKARNEAAKIGNALESVVEKFRLTGKVSAVEMARLEHAVSKSERTVASLSSRMRQFATNMGGLRGAFQRMADSAANSGGPFSKFGSLLQLAIVLMGPVIGGLIQLGGALFGIGAAAGVAAVGLGGVFIAALAQAIPLVGLAIVAFTSLAKVLKISQQQQQNQLADIGRQGAATGAAADNADRLANAQEGLIDAQRRLGDARKEAIRQLQDLADKEKSAQLAARGAALSVVDAQVALQQALASGDALSVRHAQLDLENAKVDNSQTQRDAGRTTQDARVTRKEGVEGNEGVIAARRALADAERAVTAAQKGSAASAAGLAAADARLNEEIKRLTPEQKRLLDAVNDFRNVLKGPEFTKITDTVTEPITRFVRGLSKALQDPQIISALQSTAKVYAGIFDRLGDKATGPAGRSFFADMAKEARRNGPLIEKSINSIGSIFVKVARAASPLLTGLLQSLAKSLGSADRNLSQSKLNTFFKRGGPADVAIRSFLNLFGQFVKLLSNLSSAGGAGSGLVLVNRLASAIKDVNDRMDPLSKKFDPAFVGRVKKFFNDAAKGAGDFVAALGTVGTALLSNTDPDSLKKLSDFFTKVVAPAMKNLLIISNFLSSALLFILNLPFGDKIATIIATTLIMAKAFRILQLVFGVLVPLLGALGYAIGFVAGVIIAFPIVGWILGIAALIAIVIMLEKRFHIFSRLLEWLRDKWSEIWDVIKKVFWDFSHTVSDVIDSIGEKIGSIVDFLDKLVSDITGWVSGAWTSVWDKVSSVVSGVADTVGGIFNGIKNHIVKGLNDIIDGVNWFIGLINKLPGVPNIGKLGKIGNTGDDVKAQGADHGGTANAMAAGGWVAAKPGGQPILAGEAGYDELVLSLDPKYTARNNELLRDFHARTVQKPGGGNNNSQFEGDPGAKVRKSGGGSVAAPTGRGASGAVMHLVQMLNMAQKMDAMNLPYSWGGGHTQPAHPSFGIGRGAGIFGWDCSGSVSQVLQSAYSGMPTMVAQDFPGYTSLFKPGPGAVTVWSKPDPGAHVFMDIAGRRYGTGGGQPGGGFGLNGHGTGGFRPVHPKDLGKNPAGSGFLGKALNSAIGLGGNALSAFASAVGELTDFATGFGGDFLSHFGSAPKDPIMGAIYGFVKHAVATSLKSLTAIDIPGFATGGEISGRPGQPRLIVGHGEEVVLSKTNQNTLVTSGAAIVDKLLAKIFAGVKLLAGPTVDSRTRGISGLGLSKDIENTQNKFVLFFATLGIEIEKITTRISQMARDFAQAINKQTFRVDPATGKVTRNKDENFIISATQQSQQELKDERLQLTGAINTNNVGTQLAKSRLAKLTTQYNQVVAKIHNPKTSAKDKKKLQAQAAQLLQAMQAAGADVATLQARGEDLADALDTNITAQADAQDQELQARLGVTANEDVQIGSSQLRQQLAALRGDTGGQRNELVLQGKLIADKISQLTQQQVNYAYGTPEWQEFQDAIVQNQIALEENTKAIDELSDKGLQDFSSASWQLFRQAVFNGLGGLMPQYAIPGLTVPGAAIGANILSDGLVFGHRDEKIVPANVQRSNNWGGDTNIEINVDQAGQDLDVEYLARRMAWEAQAI